MIYYLCDTETTGVSSDDKVCEVALMQIDENFNVINQHCSLVNPGKPIHYAASAVNGITDAMVADAPTLDQFMSDIGQPLLAPDVVFVAHNASFDFRFMKDFLQDDAKTLCTLKAARVIYPEATNHKQGTLAAMLGIEVPREKAHSADGDLDVLLQLLKCLCRDAECGLAELLHIQSIPRVVTKMPFGMHKGTKLEDLPKSYVTWLLTKCKTLNDDLRASLLKL